MDEKGFLERVTDNKVSDEMSQIFYKDFAEEEIIAFEKALEKVLSNLVQREKEI